MNFWLSDILPLAGFIDRLFAARLIILLLAVDETVVAGLLTARR